MTCIKQSDITSTWAVLEIQSIIRNLLRWATRVHKPNISLQLDHWQIACAQRPSQRPAQTGETPVSPLEPLPTAAIKNHNRVNSLRDIELMAMVRKLEEEKAELEQANSELQERNAKLASFLKQATGQICEALYHSRRPDSAMATSSEDDDRQPATYQARFCHI